MKYREALPEIQKKLQHPFPMVRTYSIKALSEYADAPTYPLITGKLLDPAEGVRLEAMKAVVKLKIKSAEPNLLENLKYPMGIIKREAAHALGAVGTNASIQELSKLKDDKDKSVAEAAVNAIEMINKRSAGK
jgi:HEAT repeat protein